MTDTEDLRLHGLVGKSGLKINGQDIVYGILQQAVSAFDPVYIDLQVTNTSLGAMSGQPSYTPTSFAWSPDGTYLAVGRGESAPGVPGISIYKNTGGSFAIINTDFHLYEQFGTVNGVAFSPDGEHLAMATYRTPYFLVYKRSGDTFTKLTVPVVQPSGVNDVTFSPDGKYLATAQYTPNTTSTVSVYSRNGDVYTSVALPNAGVQEVAHCVRFTPDGTRLIIGHQYFPYISAYSLQDDVFDGTGIINVVPTGGSVSEMSISPDGVYLAVVTGGIINIFKCTDADYINGGFIKMDNPITTPSSATGVSFSHDGLFLAVTTMYYPYLSIFKRIGDDFTLFNVPSQPLEVPYGEDSGHGVAYSHGGAYLIFGHQSEPCMTLYRNTYSSLILKSTDINLLTGRYGAGYVKKDGNTGNVAEVVRIFK